MVRDIEAEVGRIVEEGRDIGARVRDVVEETAATEERSLLDLTRSVMTGATEAVERATPDDPTSTLRQVVDGLGEGLERTAHATKLALEEATGRSRAFAESDLHRVAEDLRAIGTMFVDTVERGVRRTAERTRAEAGDLRKHAERTIEAIGPALEAAARAAAADPLELAGESAQTAARLTREAAGALTSAVGRMLRKAGDRLDPRDGE